MINLKTMALDWNGPTFVASTVNIIITKDIQISKMKELHMICIDIYTTFSTNKLNYAKKQIKLNR